MTDQLFQPHITRSIARNLDDFVDVISLCCTCRRWHDLMVVDHALWRHWVMLLRLALRRQHVKKKKFRKATEHLTAVSLHASLCRALCCRTSRSDFLSTEQQLHVLLYHDFVRKLRSTEGDAIHCAAAHKRFSFSARSEPDYRTEIIINCDNCHRLVYLDANDVSFECSHQRLARAVKGVLRVRTFLAFNVVATFSSRRRESDARKEEMSLVLSPAVQRVALADNVIAQVDNLMR